jgi:LmbE family N-acetylglucosaminyl deacetylase
MEMDVFVPDGGAVDAAWERVTHLGIGAHADDLEFMAMHGIAECRAGRGAFGGVVVTDGAGSVRADGLPESELRAVRREEQREAARLGGYAVVAQLGFASAEARNSPESIEAGLGRILAHVSPRIVYTHNPADRHDTHVAVCLSVLRVLRALPEERRPHRVYGCEVWRDLDWLTGDDRVRLDCGDDAEFADRLAGVFRSQIEGGKRYDLAVAGRRRAQATFDEPRAADAAGMVTLAMDLTPLVRDPGTSIAAHVLGCVDRFRDDVAARLRACGEP